MKYPTLLKLRDDTYAARLIIDTTLDGSEWYCGTVHSHPLGPVVDHKTRCEGLRVDENDHYYRALALPKGCRVRDLDEVISSGDYWWYLKDNGVQMKAGGSSADSGRTVKQALAKWPYSAAVRLTSGVVDTIFVTKEPKAVAVIPAAPVINPVKVPRSPSGTPPTGYRFLVEGEITKETDFLAPFGQRAGQTLGTGGYNAEIIGYTVGSRHDNDFTTMPFVRALDVPAPSAEVIALKAYVARLTAERADLQSRFDNLTTSNRRLTEAKTSLEGDVALLRSQHAAQRTSIEQYQTEVRDLNRNSYRQAQIAASSGTSAGTTQLDLEVTEQRPWGVMASYDNTGTENTGEDRVSVGVSWANAFGRGDQASYRFIADPTLEHSKTHSLTYISYLPWRQIATFTGSYSSISSIMAAPFTQEGKSWQTGLRYEVPLKAPRQGWAQNLSFSADFKYSDNNLEFAAIPITNNITHIAQLGATYGVSFAKFGGQNTISFSGYVSPGGLTRYNKTSAFDGSRPGAKAEYAYGTLALSHRHSLPHGFWWMTSANAQIASGALLGSEQLNGGGSSAVRGYRESSAFGDAGVVVSNELHGRPFTLIRGCDSLDLFGFVDLASLDLNVDHESTDLRSVGVGLNYQFARHFSARASYGWQLKYLDRSTDKARANVGATLSW